MGTDIHGGMFRRYRGDKNWRFMSEVPRNRNYALFAALAGVRNGHGFAGVETFEPLVPIAEDRGLPSPFLVCVGTNAKGEDVNVEIAGDGSLLPGARRTIDFDFGDHSMTHMTLEELIEWPGWDKELSDSGFLSRQEYDHWQERLRADPKATPKSYSGGVWGQNVVKTTQAEILAGTAPNNWTDVQCRWNSPMRDECPTFLKWLDWLRIESHYDLYKERNEPNYTEYMLVIGFDS